MKKKSLSIDDLKVQSFITEIEPDTESKAYGGATIPCSWSNCPTADACSTSDYYGGQSCNSCGSNPNETCDWYY